MRAFWRNIVQGIVLVVLSVLVCALVLFGICLLCNVNNAVAGSELWIIACALACFAYAIVIIHWLGASVNEYDYERETEEKQ